MGFYSIYKIIKDMITTLFGKHALKLIIICVIFSIILFSLDKKTQAYSTSDNLTFTFHNLATKKCPPSCINTRNPSIIIIFIAFIKKVIKSNSS